MIMRNVWITLIKLWRKLRVSYRILKFSA